MTSTQNLIAKILRSKFFQDSSWAVIGSAVSKAAAMVVGIIIARLLGVEAFGEYGMVKSTLFYIAVFSTFGLGSTSTRYMARCDKDDYQAVAKIIRNSITITLMTSSVMAVLLFIFAGLVTTEPHLVEILKYTSLIVIFNALNTTQIGLLSGLKLFKAIAINNALSGIATFILGPILTYFWGLNGAVLSLFTATLLQCILNHFALRRYLKSIANAATEQTTNGEQATIGNLFFFSLPIALQECVYASASWIRVMMVTTLAGYSQLGLYTATNQCHLIIIFIPGVLRSVILSHLSSSMGDAKNHSKTLTAMLKTNLICTLIPAAGISLLSPVIESIYGESFAGLVPVLIVTAVVSIFESISDTYVQEFISHGKNWIVFGGYVIRNYGSILIALPLLHRYGAEHGAFMAYSAIMVTQIIYCLMLHIVYRKSIKV